MLQDVRHALRLWRRHPPVTVLVVLTLAIGIAAATVVFSLTDAILWHPLPFTNADRLFNINRVGDQGVQYGIPQDALERWTGDAVFDFAFRYGTRAGDPVVDIHGEPEVIGIVEVAPGLITALSSPPPFGRDFTEADARDGAEPVAIVSDGLARRLATGHGDPPTAITIGGVRHMIVGIMPPGFAFPISRTTAWLPRPHSRIGRSDVVARIRRGLTLAQAQQLVDVTSASSTAAPTRQRLRLMPFAAVSAQTTTALRVLAGAVALLLLIAIGNAANVLLADAVRREAEMALRSSLGASRWRLARQIVAEVLIRSMAAAAVSVALSVWTLAMISKSVPLIISFRALRPIALDWRALLFCVAIAAAAGLVAGVTSMARAAGSTHLDARLRAFGWRTRDHARIRSALLVAQLALTVAVLAAAGLLGHAFVKLSRVDYGFDPEHLVSFGLRLPARPTINRDVQSTLDRLRAEASKVPDVVAVTISDSLPPQMDVGAAGGLETLDRGRLSNPPPSVSFAVVDDAFFKTVGIQLIGGRVFDERDTPTGPLGVVVSRSLASRLWPGENPSGREFRADLGEAWMTVIGIVGDVNSGGFDQPLGPLAYYLARGQGKTVWPYEKLTVRVRQDPARAIPVLRSLIRRVVPDAPIVSVQTAYETIGDVNARVRFITFMMMGFAGIALALALIGVYGAFSCAVEQRRKEIGVRLALGAAPGDVMRMMMRTSVRLTLVALGIGLPLAFATTPVLRSLLFEVSPGNPETFALVTLLLIVAALAATYVPAQRAASVDPIEMLRCD